MADFVYHETTPLRLSPDIFRLFQYSVTDLTRSTGIIVEDGCPEFMTMKQSGVKLLVKGHAAIPVPRAFSCGKFTSPFKYEYPGAIDYFAVKLQPWTAAHFIPVGVVDNLVDLSTIFGPEIETWCDRVFASATFAEMVETTEEFFSRIEMPAPESYRLAMNVCCRVYSSNGMISINALVNEFAESRQKINRNFLHHTRHSLKEFAVLVKIRAAIKFKVDHPEISLTELAQEFGYFDQSHFNRDLKKATGVTPTFLFSHENFNKDQWEKNRT